MRTESTRWSIWETFGLNGDNFNRFELGVNWKWCQWCSVGEEVLESWWEFRLDFPWIFKDRFKNLVTQHPHNPHYCSSHNIPKIIFLSQHLYDEHLSPPVPLCCQLLCSLCLCDINKEIAAQPRSEQIYEKAVFESEMNMFRNTSATRLPVFLCALSCLFLYSRFITAPAYVDSAVITRQCYSDEWRDEVRD